MRFRAQKTFLMHLGGSRCSTAGAGSNALAYFLWVEVVIDKSIDDFRKLRLNQSVTESFKSWINNTKKRAQLQEKFLIEK